MTGFSEDGTELNNSTSQKRQRTCGDTEEKNKRTATLLDLDAIDCPVCFDPLTICIFQHCAFTQRACPFSSCDFIGMYKDLYEHSVAKHCKSSYMFECGTPVFMRPSSGKRVILMEQTTEGQGEGELVVMECFDTPQGPIFYASCLGPGTENFYYDFKLFSSSGDRLFFESKLKRVREVSDEPPGRHFMLVPSFMCPNYNFYICIKRGPS